jgi:hypothetical protein
MARGSDAENPPSAGHAKLRVWSTFRRPMGDGSPVTASLESPLPPLARGVMQLGAVLYSFRRVKRVLGLWTGFAIPVSAEVVGDDYLGFHAAAEEVFLTSSQRFELPGEIEGIYATAGHVLREVSPESILGAAVENVGASALDDDPDLRYLHAWNGIELLAKANYYRRRAGAGLPGPSGKRPKLPGNAEIIPPLIRKYHPSTNPPDIQWIRILRNGAAHGGLSDYPGRNFEEYVERWSKSAALCDLARETLVAYLADQAILPTTWAGRPARVLVWSDGRTVPVDESSVLSGRGIANPSPGERS